MARSLQAGADALYTATRTWLDRCLNGDGSLLDPDATIWTTGSLSELRDTFVENPDLTPGKSFLDKLHGQIGSASPEAIQLMAELHVIHFLMIWKGAIGAAKKQADLEVILGWGAPISHVPASVTDLFETGIAHPGQFALTRRDTQLTYLIHFGLAWKRLSAEERAAAGSDPWALKEFAMGVESPSADNQRFALMHLLFPETFEAIVSLDHKKLIAERWQGLVHAPMDDIDRRLLEIRGAMTPQLGVDFNWYHEPQFRSWWKDKKAWIEFMKWLKLFRASPSFDATERDFKIEAAERVAEARAAVEGSDAQWVTLVKRAFANQSLTNYRAHAPFVDWVEAEPDAAIVALAPLWTDGDAPNRLDAFCSHLPEVVLPTPGERLNVGSFLLMATDPTALPVVKISSFRRAWKLLAWGEPEGLSEGMVYGRALQLLDEIVHEGRNWDPPVRDRLDAQGALWWMTNVEDKPDGWSDEQHRQFLDYLAQGGPRDPVDGGGPGVIDEVTDHLAAAAESLLITRDFLDEIVGLLRDKGQVVLYGPPGTGKTFLAHRLALAIAEGDESRVRTVQFHPATTYEDFFEGLRPELTQAGQLNYVLRSGPLVRLADQARAASDKVHVMLIDEINRANLPKVLGELLYLLEYRRHRVQTLYRPDEPFGLPENLWFIGTMNTADRSTALVDAALRRRFHFVPIFPDEGPMEGLLARWLKRQDKDVVASNLLKAVNKDLLGVFGAHQLIGPSYFMTDDLSEAGLERIWTYNIFPLIEERLWGAGQGLEKWRWPSVRARYLGGPAEPVESPMDVEPDPVSDGGVDSPS